MSEQRLKSPAVRIWSRTAIACAMTSAEVEEFMRTLSMISAAFVVLFFAASVSATESAATFTVSDADWSGSDIT